MAGPKTDPLGLSASEMLSFKLTHALARNGPRLGSLAFRGRPEMQTPNYFANTSRGIIPHISQDLQAKHMSVAGVYMALEDCELISNSHFSPNQHCNGTSKADAIQKS